MSEIKGKSKEEIKKDFKKYGGKYQKYIYQVEKEINVEDVDVALNFNLIGIRIYILFNRTNKMRFLYYTTQKLFLDTEILGKSLHFIKHNRYKPMKLKFYKDVFNQKQIYYIPDTDEEHTGIELVPNDFIVKEIKDPNLEENDKPKLKNISQKPVHPTRYAFDNTNWFKEELAHLDFENLNNKILNDILEGATIDSRIRKVLITEFFSIPQIYDIEENTSIDYMKNNSHSIVLTQGSTGKSSILCLMGNDLTKTSDAGMFGYMDVSNNSWRAGEVSKTKKAIIVDEINEIISSNAKKGDSVLDTLNTPLENGKFNYGKAGGMKVNFGNQFNFLGNIKDDFHFENFVNGLSTNQATMGRRFAYIIYDNSVKWKNGNQRDITKHLNKINPLAEFLSKVLLFFLQNKKFIDKKINQNAKFMNKINNVYKKKLFKVVQDVEHPNTKQFLKTFVEYSLENRVPIMSLKLTLFKHLGELMTSQNLDEFTYSQNLFMEHFYNEYDELILDLELSFKNIVSHQNTSIIENSSDKIFEIRLNKELSNNQKLLFIRICESIEPMENKISYSDLKIKGRLKFIKNNLKRGSSPKDKVLNKYGIFPKVKDDDVEFILNRLQFERTLSIIEKSKMEILGNAGETEYVNKEKVYSKEKELKKENEEKLKQAEEKAEKRKEEIENAWSEKESSNESEKQEVSIGSEKQEVSIESEKQEVSIESEKENKSSEESNEKITPLNEVPQEKKDLKITKNKFDIDEIILDDDLF